MDLPSTSPSSTQDLRRSSTASEESVKVIETINNLFPMSTPPSSGQDGAVIEKLNGQTGSVEATSPCAALPSKRKFAELAADGDDFDKPIINLGTELMTIHQGDHDQAEHIVHLHVISHHSPSIRHRLQKANVAAHAHVRCKLLRRELKMFLQPRMTLEQFSADGYRGNVTKAVNKVLTCYTDFPLKDYQHFIKYSILHKVDEYLAKLDCYRAKPADGRFRRKDDSSSELRNGLTLLNSSVIRSIVHALTNKLWTVKSQEETKARTDRDKAAAHRIVYVKGFETTTVSIVIHWLYYQDLRVDSVAQACSVHMLAKRLDIGDLAAICMDTLIESLVESLTHFRQEGRTLRSVLSEGLSLVDQISIDVEDIIESKTFIVASLFQYVLSEKITSDVLHDLVINALAEAADPDLIPLVQPFFSNKVSSAFMMAQARRLLPVTGAVSQYACIEQARQEQRRSIKIEKKTMQKAADSVNGCFEANQAIQDHRSFSKPTESASADGSWGEAAPMPGGATRAFQHQT